jgi:hypothetical protein
MGVTVCPWHVEVKCVEVGDPGQCGLRVSLCELGRERWAVIVTATDPGAFWDHLSHAEKEGKLSADQLEFVRKAIRSVRRVFE